ncbi:MAG: hypothetical protein AAF754_19355, partial [Pseudomonadota bacterium]
LLHALQAQPAKAWIQVSPRPGRFDPLHQVTHRFVSDINAFCLKWQEKPASSTPPEWKQRWLNADAEVESIYRQELENAQVLSEPMVARTLTKMLPEDHGFVLGASMPIRDVNQFAAPNIHQVHVASNRGASGIDGTLATAVGFAEGLAQCTTVLLGDLATFRHVRVVEQWRLSRVLGPVLRPFAFQQVEQMTQRQLVQPPVLCALLPGWHQSVVLLDPPIRRWPDAFAPVFLIW